MITGNLDFEVTLELSGVNTQDTAISIWTTLKEWAFMKPR